MVVLKNTNITVLNPDEMTKVLQDLLALEDSIDQGKEHFYAIHVNTRNKIILVEVVSIGTVNASLVHPREVFRRAIQENTVSILIAHNHPSGNVEPSEEDIKVTKKLVEAGKILGIELLDHIVFSDKDSFSMKQGHCF